MGWRNIDSIESIDRGGYRVCALGKSKRQHDIILFWHKHWFYSSWMFEASNTCQAFVEVLFLRCQCLDKLLFSFAAWFRWVVLFFHLPGSLDADGGFGLRVARSCARASGLSFWLWKHGCAEVRKFRWLLNSGAKTNHFFMLMTKPSCLQLLSSPSSPCTIRPTWFVVSSMFVF